MCCKAFGGFRGLEFHRVHHGSEGFLCTLCHQRLPSLQRFQSHLSSHSPVHVFECQKCGKTFIRPGSFHKHRLRCTKAIKFECSQCTLQFKSSVSLKDHVNVVHGGLAAYCCRKCDEAFAWRASRSRHEAKCSK